MIKLKKKRMKSARLEQKYPALFHSLLINQLIQESQVIRPGFFRFVLEFAQSEDLFGI